jgi:membrane protease YdiL (CAAX protease family)
MTLETSPQLQESLSEPARAVNWKQVGAFLALTFSLTWLLDLVLFLNGGLKNPNTGLMLQLQMLLPAFSALLLGTFFFKNSPIYFRGSLGPGRWFIYFYFSLTVLYAGGAAASLLLPGAGQTLSLVLLIPSVIGLILLLVLRWVGGKETYTRLGMGGGSAKIWLLYGLGLALYYGVQTLLNYLFGLGKVVDLMALAPQLAASGMPAWVLTLSAAFNAVVIGPFLGLIITFGEEYGWRGYLQSELNHLGRVRGVLLLGVIWGIWHWPVIWMGYNYPGQPVWGSLLMTAFTIELAFFLAYAVYKSKGVWTAAYLHALNNQVFSFFCVAVVAPSSVIFSFGLGLPGLALGALVVLLILRDPLWRE